MLKTFCEAKEVSKGASVRGLSGYHARRRVADSRGLVHVASLSLNKQETIYQLPNPKVCGLP